jgi:hypothetical protein
LTVAGFVERNALRAKLVKREEEKLVSGLQNCKAILCEKDSYLLELVRYTYLNPVRSKMVEDPMAYLWSSHRT